MNVRTTNESRYDIDYMRMKRQKTVSIISRESDSKTLDIAMLEEELLRRGLRVNVLSRLLTKERSLKALGYIGHVIRQELAILGSDVVVLDTYCIPASMLPHRSGTKVVQIWHALGAIKKFGWQTVGMQGGSSERTARLMRMHRGYDFIACAGEVTADAFCEAFRADRSSIVKLGLPRIDYIKSVASGERREDMRRRIYTRYPELAGSRADGSRADRQERPPKKLILYAPTFRRSGPVDVNSLLRAIDADSFDVVVKLHPLYRGEASPEDHAAPEGLTVIYDEEFSSYDWLAAADIIISDYSSFVIEATLADRPLYVYAYDIEEYSRETGLNTDFGAEPIAPYVYGDAETLAKALAEDYDFGALHAFRDRYIDIDTDRCTAALADFIEELADSPRTSGKRHQEEK